MLITTSTEIFFKYPQEAELAEEFRLNNHDWDVAECTEGITFKQQNMYYSKKQQNMCYSRNGE